MTSSHWPDLMLTITPTCCRRARGSALGQLPCLALQRYATTLCNILTMSSRHGMQQSCSSALFARQPLSSSPY